MSIANQIIRLINAKTNLKSSINAKNDGQHQITNETLENYSTFVDNIETGGNLQSKSVTITDNTTTNISPDTGYDGLESVSVTTNISKDIPVFSTTETVVGTWIDNRPLYMKTYTQPITVTSSGYDVKFDHGLTNIGIMFLGNNSFIAPTNDMSQSYPINYTNTSSNTYSNLLRTNISTNGKIRTLNNGGIFSNGTEITVVINVFYTKTTDSVLTNVNEIRGNHFAETEHIVGETNTGETIYEKTVLKSAYHGYNNPFNQTFSHNISNIKKIWIADGSFLYSLANANDKQYLPLNYVNANTDKQRQFLRANVNNTNISIYIGDYMLGNGTVNTFTTLRYIKNEI